MAEIKNDYLEFKEALLEFWALCKAHPSEDLWQNNIFRRIDALFLKYFKFQEEFKNKLKYFATNILRKDVEKYLCSKCRKYIDFEKNKCKDKCIGFYPIIIPNHD